MSNTYWMHVSPFVSGTTVRSDSMNAKLDGLETGFELVEAAVNKRLSFPTNFTGTKDVPNTWQVNSFIMIDGVGNISTLQKSAFDADVATCIAAASSASSSASSALAQASAAAGSATAANNSAIAAGGSQTASAASAIVSQDWAT